MESKIDSRGHFWWGDQFPHDGSALPVSPVAGRLTIEETGKILLALDGLLSDGLRSVMTQFNSTESITDRMIAGLLYESSEYVCLSNLRITSGHFGGVSREVFQARYCLRGDFSPPTSDCLSAIKRIRVDLSNIEEWLKGPRIKTLDSTVDGAVVKQLFEYQREEIRYPVAGGTLSINFDVHPDPSFGSIFGSNKVSFGCAAKLGYEPIRPMSIEKVQEFIARLQEFLALLIGVHVDLDWPNVTIAAGEADGAGTFYFMRNRPSGENPSMTDLWSIFPRLRNSVGDLLGSFMAARDQYGPGVYLYLACLRSESMFAENRFTTLITGLESLYRRDPELPQESRTERDRIERILAGVQLESDGAWLRKRLETRAELSLDDRLFRLFSPLTKYVDAARLKVFARECAVLRNDITHFGGLRGSTTYPELLKRLGALTPALTNLYHALLLHRIGVPQDIIGEAFTSSPLSWELKRHLVQAGLLDEERKPTQVFPPARSEGNDRAG